MEAEIFVFSFEDRSLNLEIIFLTAEAVRPRVAVILNPVLVTIFSCRSRGAEGEKTNNYRGFLTIGFRIICQVCPTWILAKLPTMVISCLTFPVFNRATVYPDSDE